MEGDWAILNTNGEVIALHNGLPWEFDNTGIENYGGEVKYSAPYQHRGTPVIGSIWNNELDKFE